MSKKPFKRFLKTINYEITMGHTVVNEEIPLYEYTCTNDNGSAYMTFYPETLEVDTIAVEDFLGRNQFYIWYGNKNEPVKDESPYIRTDDLNDILEKVHCILNNRKFNTDVVINLDFGSEKFKRDFQDQARLAGLTIDDLMVKIIRNAIEKEKN